MASRHVVALASALTVVMCASVATVQAANPQCDPSYECKFVYTAPDGSKSHTFDFTSLCSATDYVLTDVKGHNYYAQICGTAKQNCLPATWQNTYEYGVAVQTWGQTPPCGNPPACKSKQGQAACCTADCQVLGQGPPQWSLVDPSNPSTGGVQAHHQGAAASDSDPFWCTFNPTTGAQYERHVTFVFECDPSVLHVEPIAAIQNVTNDCQYTLRFKTSKACAASGGRRASAAATAAAPTTWVASVKNWASSWLE
mmetsp:Transcript_65735/g.133524  ORF Transcript_65735/g.133524 Transcript_65735/m.133524 type:complete len:255 (+) Transcript_65735:83-847(+)